MTDHTLTFNVTGLPAPQGSKRGFYNKNLGRVQMVESSNKVAPWRQDVVAAALHAIAEQGWTPPAKAAEVDVTFYLPRIKAHFRTGNRSHELRPDAPELVDKKPDLDKLARSTLDALTSSGVLRDDAQVARLCVEKRYASGPTGAQITVRSLDSVAAALPSPEHAAATVQEALL